MKSEHNFTTPRNLFEKLLRDSDKFDKEPNGDNFFNFITTAYHLKEWIKKSPISSHEATKRMLHKVSRHPLMKKCCGIVEGDSTFVFEVEDGNNSSVLKVGEEIFNPSDAKNEILNLFKDYFEMK
jgi:hypothetical protein